jgi:hypothetical protein
MASNVILRTSRHYRQRAKGKGHSSERTWHKCILLLSKQLYSVLHNVKFVSPVLNISWEQSQRLVFTASVRVKVASVSLFVAVWMQNFCAGGLAFLFPVTTNELTDAVHFAAVIHHFHLLPTAWTKANLWQHETPKHRKIMFFCITTL